MTLGLGALLNLVLVPFLIGAGGLAALGVGDRFERLAFVAWSVILGSLCLGLVVMSSLALGLPMHALPLIGSSLGSLGLLTFCLRRGRLNAKACVEARADGGALERPAGPVRGERLGQVLFGVVLVAALALCVGHMRAANASLIVVGDEVGIFANKAKGLYLAADLGAALDDIFRDAGDRPSTMHLDYPMLNPTLMVWSFSHAGEVLHLDNRLPIQACVLALVLLLASELRRAAGPLLATALLIVVVSSSPFRMSCIMATADGMLALGFLACAGLLERLRRQWSVGHARLLAVALAFMLASKNEGLLLALALMLPASVSWIRAHGARVASGRLLGVVWAPLALVAAQALFNRAHAFSNDLFSTPQAKPLLTRALAQLGTHLPATLRALFDHAVLNLEQSQLLLPGMSLLLLISPRRLGPVRTITWVAVVLALLGIVTVYVATPHDIDWHLRTSMKRVLFHLLPAIAVWVAAAGQALLQDARRPEAPPGA